MRTTFLHLPLPLVPLSVATPSASHLKCARKGCDRIAPAGKILCLTCGTVCLTDTLDNIRAIGPSEEPTRLAGPFDMVSLAETLLKNVGDAGLSAEDYLDYETRTVAARSHG